MGSSYNYLILLFCYLLLLYYKVIKESKKVRLSSDDLPSGNKFKTSTITIVIKLIVKKD